MLASSLVASVHYLALALGLGGLWMRGRFIRQLALDPKNQAQLHRLFVADNCWGIATLFWIATGLMRAFGGLEKGTAYYLHNPLFWVKMGLFGIVGALEILPMVTFIRWRIADRRGAELSGWERLSLFRTLNDCQAGLVVAIPFVASAMARGLGL